MSGPINVLRKEHIVTGRVFDLERHLLEMPNGYKINLELIRHPGASAVVPILDDEYILMIRQYRYAVGGYILEIPAGTLRDKEDPVVCAKRELEEETGYLSDEIISIGKIYPLPGYSDETIYLFLAKCLTRTSQNLDKDEILQVNPVKVQDVYKMIERGEIIDAKTICGLYLAREFLIG